MILITPPDRVQPMIFRPVNISGFGKWTVKAKKARKGRNPKTGKEMTIDARRVVTFKSSNVLRDAINNDK
jgi:integration host factor subunit alpha